MQYSYQLALDSAGWGDSPSPPCASSVLLLRLEGMRVTLGPTTHMGLHIRASVALRSSLLAHVALADDAQCQAAADHKDESLMLTRQLCCPWYTAAAEAAQKAICQHYLCFCFCCCFCFHGQQAHLVGLASGTGCCTRSLPALPLLLLLLLLQLQQRATGSSVWSYPWHGLLYRLPRSPCWQLPCTLPPQARAESSAEQTSWPCHAHFRLSYALKPLAAKVARGV